MGVATVLRAIVSLTAWVVLLLASVCPVMAEMMLSVEDIRRENPEEAGRMDAFEQVVVNPAQTAAETMDEVVIAVVYPEIQQSLYWARNIDALTARLQERGVRYRLARFASPPHDVDLQLLLVREALALDPDYLLFHLDSPRHIHTVDWLLARQRPVVLLQNVTSLPARWKIGSRPLLSTGFDHQTGTAMLADYFHRRFGRKGAKYAMITTAPGYLSEVRGDHFVNQLVAKGMGRPVDRYFVPISYEEGYAAGLELALRHDDLDFIYVAATDLALGAAAALRDKFPGRDLVLNGWGGGESELDALQAGLLGVTVMRMNDDAGVAQADAIWLHLTGRGEEVPVLWSGQFALVEAGMDQEEVARLQQRAFRYSSRTTDGQ